MLFANFIGNSETSGVKTLPSNHAKSPPSTVGKQGGIPEETYDFQTLSMSCCCVLDFSCNGGYVKMSSHRVVALHHGQISKLVVSVVGATLAVFVPVCHWLNMNFVCAILAPEHRFCKKRLNSSELMRSKTALVHCCRVLSKVMHIH